MRNNKLQKHSFFSIKNKVLKRVNQSFFYRLTPVSLLILTSFFFIFNPSKVISSPESAPIDSLKTSTIWLGAQVLPGSGQFINKQYWKIPVVYSGMGSMIYLGHKANLSYLNYKNNYKQSLLEGNAAISEQLKQKYYEQRQARNLFYAGAGVFYLASVADALLVYNKNNHSPATATILSTVVPGLGQIYNEKYWKVPVVYGGLSTFYFMVDWNNRGYKRFKKAYALQIDAVSNNTHSEFEELQNGTWVKIRSDEEVKLIKDSYRRYRDLSALGFAFVYILNIVDANVDANLYDWDVSDDLSLRVEPNYNSVNFGASNTTASVFGLSCKITF